MYFIQYRDPKSRDGEFDPETNLIFLSRDLRSRDANLEIQWQYRDFSRDNLEISKSNLEFNKYRFF